MLCRRWINHQSTNLRSNTPYGWWRFGISIYFCISSPIMDCRSAAVDWWDITQEPGHERSNGSIKWNNDDLDMIVIKFKKMMILLAYEMTSNFVRIPPIPSAMEITRGGINRWYKRKLWLRSLNWENRGYRELWSAGFLRLPWTNWYSSCRSSLWTHLS